MRIPAALACLLLALPLPLRAQSVTGSIEGRVVDTAGSPIDGVVVTVTGPDLLGSRTGMSESRGNFRVAALPPGAYTLSLTVIGYRSVVFESVPVRLGQTSGLGDVSLEETAVELDPVVVEVERPAIDPSSTTLGTSLEAEAYENLPTDRAFRSILTLLPHANASYLGDDANIAGATGSENAYFIDGINITDPHLGVTRASLPYSFIKAIEVKEGGYEAEFGRALGGLVNVVTYSGGNEFSGRAFGFLTNSGLAGEYLRGGLDSSVESFATYDAGISFGGPIVRDRLWFFGAYDRTFEDQRIEVPGWGVHDDARRTDMFAGKLSWQATEGTDLTLSVLGDPGDHHFIRIPAGVVSLENIDPILGYGELGGVTSSLQVRSFVGDALLLEGSVSHGTTSRTQLGDTERGVEEPLMVDVAVGAASGGFGLRREAHTSRTAVSLNAGLTLHRHRVKAGVSYEENTVDYLNQWTPPGDIDKVGPSTYTALVVLMDLVVKNRVPSVYVQDSWIVTPWFRLNAGVRWDGQYLIGSEGDLAQPIAGQLQPRLGFALQPGTPGRHKIFGSYGRFYQQLPLNASTLGHSLWVNRLDIYSQDPRNPGVAPDRSLVFVDGESYNSPRIDDLRGEHTDEFVLGYELGFGGPYTAALRGVHRALRDCFSVGFTAGTFIGGNPGKGELSFLPRCRREYSALEASLQRARAGNLDFTLSYVLSRSYGNYLGLYNSDSRMASPNNNHSLATEGQIPNSTGLLPNDRTHVLKARGTRRFDRGLTVGASLAWMSGTPLSEFGPAPPGSLSHMYTFLVERGSAGRTPSSWDLNLRGAYDLPVRWSSSREATLVLDLLHVGSPRRAVDIDQVHYLLRDADGNRIANPTHGQVLLYQPPMTLRIGFEVAF